MEWTPTSGEQERHNVTVITVGSKYNVYVRPPASSQTQTLQIKRGEYFSKEVFLCLPSCRFFMRLPSCVVLHASVFVVVSLWIILHIYVHVCRCESTYVTILTIRSWWKSTFSFSSVAVFWRLLLNAPMMLYNICYYWFFLSQSNQWTKCLAHPKIRRPKPRLLLFLFLVTFDTFNLLLSTQLTTDLTLKWSGGSIFYP